MNKEETTCVVSSLFMPYPIYLESVRTLEKTLQFDPLRR